MKFGQPYLRPHSLWCRPYRSNSFSIHGELSLSFYSLDRLVNISLQLPIHDMLLSPNSAGEAQESLKCFAIPYGAFHFASYCFFFWMFLCALGRRYYWKPWNVIPKSHPSGPLSHLVRVGLLKHDHAIPSRKFNSILYMTATTFGSLVRLAISLYSVKQCAGHYRLLAIAKALQAGCTMAFFGLLLASKFQTRRLRMISGILSFMIFGLCE